MGDRYAEILYESLFPVWWRIIQSRQELPWIARGHGFKSRLQRSRSNYEARCPSKKSMPQLIRFVLYEKAVIVKNCLTRVRAWICARRLMKRLSERQSRTCMLITVPHLGMLKCLTFQPNRNPKKKHWINELTRRSCRQSRMPRVPVVLKKLNNGWKRRQTQKVAILTTRLPLYLHILSYDGNKLKRWFGRYEFNASHARVIGFVYTWLM